MGIEIERRFLVDPSKFPDKLLRRGCDIHQGYITTTPPIVRVRLITYLPGCHEGRITVKGEGTIRRLEYEYHIPSDDAEELIAMCKYTVKKTRHDIRVEDGGYLWEVDDFRGFDLWLAEVELRSETESVPLPPWVTKEVTEDPRYTNISLAMYGKPE